VRHAMPGLTFAAASRLRSSPGLDLQSQHRPILRHLTLRRGAIHQPRGTGRVGNVVTTSCHSRTAA
jgi:hypothetical protein